MEHLEFEFGPWPAGLPSASRQSAIAGVVGSGNLEVLLEPTALQGRMRVALDTSIRGFDATWQAVLSDFAERERFADVLLTINDAGATPAVVSLRLAQVAQQWREQ